MDEEVCPVTDRLGKSKNKSKVKGNEIMKSTWMTQVIDLQTALFIGPYKPRFTKQG